MLITVNNIRFISIFAIGLAWLTLFQGCSRRNATQPLEKDNLLYELINESGIEVEYFNDSIQAGTRFTDDNSIYVSGAVHRFQFSYLDANGVNLYFTPDNNTNPMESKFSISETNSDTSMHSFKLRVEPGLSIYANDEDYRQSVIDYSFYYKDGKRLKFSEKTGLIENEGNIWIHPPRVSALKVLEIAPFPFVKFPLEEGKTYTWNLNIGDIWSTVIHQWEGPINNNITYKVVGTVSNPTTFGGADCWKINAEATSSIGSVHSTFLFDPIAGFVSMQHVYPNSDTLSMWRVE
jgi:hypothetical protein